MVDSEGLTGKAANGQSTNGLTRQPAKENHPGAIYQWERSTVELGISLRCAVFIFIALFLIRVHT